MQLPQALRPLLARPHPGLVEPPGIVPTLNFNSSRPSRRLFLSRLRLGTTSRWVKCAISRSGTHLPTSVSAPRPTASGLTSASSPASADSDSEPASEVGALPADAVVPTRFSSAEMFPSAATRHSRVRLYPASTPAHSVGGSSTTQAAGQGSARVVRCYSWRSCASLPGRARLRIVSHWRLNGGGGAAAAADGSDAGVSEDHGTNDALAPCGAARGCNSSSSVTSHSVGSSVAPLSPERILLVSEAYVEAWWRGVARGAAAAEEELKQLVVTTPVGGGGEGGSSGEGNGGDGSAAAAATATAAAAVTGGASSGAADVRDAAVQQQQQSPAKGPHRHYLTVQQQQQQHHPQRKEQRLNRQHPHPHPHLHQQDDEQRHQVLAERHQQGDQEHQPHEALALALMPDGVLHKRPLRGYDALVGQLAAQHAEYHRVQYRPITSAASCSSSCGYVLGEYRMQDVGGLAGHPATFRVSRGYCLFKLRLDPASGRISRGWVRRQMTQEERDERVWDAVHVYPAAFPLERMHLTRDGKPDPRVMEEAACAWVAAQAKPSQRPPLPSTGAEMGLTMASESSEWRASGTTASGRSRLALLPGGHPGDAGAPSDPDSEGKQKSEDRVPGAGAGEDVAAEAEAEAHAAGSGVGGSGSGSGSGLVVGLEVDSAAIDEPLQAAGPAAGAGVGEVAADSTGGPAPNGSGAGSKSGVPGPGAGPGELQSVSTSGFVTSTSPEGAIWSGGGVAGNRPGSNTGGGEAAANAAATPAEVIPGAAAEPPDVLGSGPREGPDKQRSTAAASSSVASANESASSSTAAPPRAEAAAFVTAAQAGLVDRVLAPDCRLLDAYGIWPDPDDEDGKYGYGGRRQQVVVGAQQVLHRIQAQQQRCSHVEPLLYDVAVSEYHNIAFVHWINIVTPAPEPPSTKPSSQLHKPVLASGAKPVVASGTAVTRGSQEDAGVRRIAMAASSAAVAAATAASAAAQAATAAVDVAFAATAAADVATTAASTASIAATVAAFGASSGDEERRLVVEPKQQQQQGHSAGTEPISASGSGSGKVMVVDGNGGGGGGGRQMGLQDLRISMPNMPSMPNITQIPIQIQNLEEAISAAAQRVAGAAGTAAAAASAAAAAATAVIMAESGSAASDPDTAAAAAAKAALAAQQRKREAAPLLPPPPPPPPPAPVAYQQECMAALLFTEEGTVSDVWLFRGPFHYERRLIKP
ncbi:hypothetical protein VaNZ11_012219 [Volvox africanus]|uniref:Uncharacterized protein n=1 Tax=Volvox africanus TaxID=51714 RepID=A0ABQ5SED9_9CHLO|nr:hypothetical protein VaNZ11_012219 [Volvox africanus]